jgi:DNA repair exonuclease SbcCD ATPase subunit
MTFAFPERIVEKRQRDHATFYCPAGHPQCFAGESDVEQLQRQLAAAKQHAKELGEWADEQRTERKRAERQLAATKAAHTRTKNRIAHGVCPCCNRTFQNLARHMAGQHPDYTGQAE